MCLSQQAQQAILPERKKGTTMNAKQELLDMLGGARPICAEITIGTYTERVHALLITGYSESDWDAFLRQLDVEYDAGYGGQELYGTVWLPDGVWLTRGEYDGSEWWEACAYPAIPVKLQ